MFQWPKSRSWIPCRWSTVLSPDRLWDTLGLMFHGNRMLFLRGKAAASWSSPHLYLGPRLRKSGAVPPLPLACEGTSLPDEACGQKHVSPAPAGTRRTAVMSWLEPADVLFGIGGAKSSLKEIQWRFWATPRHSRSRPTAAHFFLALVTFCRHRELLADRV